MKVMETFDLSIFERLRDAGAEVDLAIKLAVAGKSLAESLYAVELVGAEAIGVLESFVKDRFGGLRGLIESDMDAYNTPANQSSVNRWVQAGAFDEELHRYALASGRQSHGATRNKFKSNCYGALFAYLEVCDLTDPLVSESTNLCHLDAMVDRVTTREALDKFLKLLVATPKTGAIQNRIFSKGFPNLDSDLDWRPIMEEVLYERDLSTFETDYPECTLALKSLGVYDQLGNREADTLTKCLINRILDEHDCPTLGESDVVNSEQLMARYLGRLMLNTLKILLPKTSLRLVGVTSRAEYIPVEDGHLDGQVYYRMEVYGKGPLMAYATVARFLYGYGTFTSAALHAQYEVVDGLLRAARHGKLENVHLSD